MRHGYVYLLCSHKNGTLYLVHEHKTKLNKKSFSADYNVNRLVWYERYDSIVDAIAAEKRMKKWKRQWKIDLIETNNPNWATLELDFDD